MLSSRCRGVLAAVQSAARRCAQVSSVPVQARACGSVLSQRRALSSAAGKVTVNFVIADGSTVSCDAAVGDTLLDVALDNDLEVEGACGGECACSTCHMILEQEVFDSLEEAEEEEEDMLDLALGLTDTSRLGCQVILSQELDGITVTLPKETLNMMAD